MARPKSLNPKWGQDNSPEYKIAAREWREANKSRIRGYWMKRKYKLTVEQFEIMRRLQDNKCAICYIEFCEEWHKANSIHIDHDHSTGTVRALLCGRCNQGIGLLDEDPLKLESAKNYLLKFGR